MTPEMQMLAERIELLERQGRRHALLAQVATVAAIVAIAIPFAMRRPPAESRVRHSVVEANRFLVRDLDGRVAGGMEVDRRGTVKLVLGSGKSGSSSLFLEAQPNGVAHVTLRGADGGVRATLIGSNTPALSLSVGAQGSSAVLATRPDGSGSLHLAGAAGRGRFKAP